MTGFQAEKDVVLRHYERLDRTAPDALVDTMRESLSETCLWRGYHPFNEQIGPEAIARSFWQLFRQSFTSMQRRMDIFMAGQNEGINPTGKMAFLRYCEFNRVENCRIVETALYFDIPHLMTQAGCNPFPVQTAAHLVQPGPLTHDGLLFGAQPKAEGEKTLATINAMINDLGTWQLGLPLEEELARTWHDDMIWWGPAGIGATYTIERYAKQHSAPFRAGFTDRSKTNHICRLAEGQYGGFFGWPNFTARPTGGFMGLPGADKSGEMRVIDIYRRNGNKLAENWVFIDLLHFWKTLGVEFLTEV